MNYQLGKIYKVVDLDSSKMIRGLNMQANLRGTTTVAKHVGGYKRYLNGIDSTKIEDNRPLMYIY
jgi:hypothetical protein